MATQTENRNTRINYLDDLDDYKVHHDDPDVRGWDIYTSDDKKIGEVENLIVDKEGRRVRYLDVHLEDDFIKGEPLATKRSGSAGKIHEHINEEGHRQLIIPIGLATLNEDKEKLYLKDYSMERLTNIPRYNKNEGITLEYEIEIRKVFLPAEISGKDEERDEDDNSYYDSKYYRYNR